MPKAAPSITSFNAGEWSSLMSGRTDIKYYTSACRKAENFVPTPQGPSLFRSGTKFMAETKDSTKKSWLVKFEFNSDQVYQMEFGNLYIRFYSNHGVVESSPGVPLEVATPYTSAILEDTDGYFNLKFVQSNDVIYIVHPDVSPRKLIRTGASSFSMAVVDFEAGPFKDTDPNETTTIYSSAQTGAVTLTASTGIFTAAHVGQMIYLEAKKVNDISQWASGAVITAGADPLQLRRSDGKTYKSTAAGTCGNIKPTHSVGTENDGNPGVAWAYQDAGYGWAKITGFTSSTVVSATVVSKIPYGATTSGQATTRWAFSVWNDADGYPSVITFFKNRLTFLRGRDGWASVVNDYENMNRKDAGGIVTKDMALVFSVTSDRANDIKWAAPSDIALLIGTAGDEHALMEITQSEAFGPGNAQARKQSDYGSKNVTEARVGGGVLFVQKSGRKIRDCVMAEAVDARWVSSDTTVMADHISKSGIMGMAYQQDPDSILWAYRRDGKLVGFTLDRQQDVRGWHRHPIGGIDPIVESISVSPDPAGDRDELWMIVARTIGGSTKRYVEYMERHFDVEEGVPEEAYHLDCGLTYRGTGVTTLTGLGHLEGQTVGILVDGATHPDKVVTGGSITLQSASRPVDSVVHVGFKYRGVLSPMPIDAGAADGTSRGKVQRISKVGIKFLRSGGASYGRDSDGALDTLPMRSANDNMDEAPSLFTGTVVVSWPDGYEGEGEITIVQDKPLPCAVVAIMPHITTQDSPSSGSR